MKTKIIQRGLGLSFSSRMISVNVCVCVWCVCVCATALLMEVKQHSVNTHNPLRTVSRHKPGKASTSVTMLTKNNNHKNSYISYRL